MIKKYSLLLTLTTILLLSSKQILANSPPIPAPPSKEKLDQLEELGRQNEEKYGSWPSGMTTDVKSSGETGLSPEVNIQNAQKNTIIQPTPSPTPSQLELTTNILKTNGLPQEFKQENSESTDFINLDYSTPLSKLTLDTPSSTIYYIHSIDTSDIDTLNLIKTANDHISIKDQNISISQQWADKFPQTHFIKIKNQNQNTHDVKLKFDETMQAKIDHSYNEPKSITIAVDGYGYLSYTISKKTLVGLTKQTIIDFIIGDSDQEDIGSIQRVIVDFLRGE